jgi:hypothetical protein
MVEGIAPPSFSIGDVDINVDVDDRGIAIKLS